MNLDKNSSIYIIYLFFEDDYRTWPHSEILDALVGSDPRGVLIGVTYPISFFTLFTNPKRFFKLIINRSQRIGDKIHSFTPLSILPMNAIHRSRIIEAFHRRWFNRQIRAFFRKNSFNGHIVSWIYCINAFPAWAKIPQSKLLVYDCRDDFVYAGDREIPGLKAMEGRLLEAADLTFFSSRQLLKIKGNKTKRSFYFSNGVDFEYFKTAKNASTREDSELSKIKRPIVGFLGITRPLVDLELVAYLANQMPQVSFVFVGPVVTASQADVHSLQKRFSNIYFLARRKKEALAPVLKTIDVGFLPYKQNKFYESTNALKLWQYLACGLPVLCAAAPEYLSYQELVALYSTKEEALEKLKVLLKEPPGFKREERMALAEGNDWGIICKQMLGEVAKCLEP